MAQTKNHRREHRRLLAALVGAVALHATVAGAAEVQLFLRNGDRLSGILLAEDGERVTLTNAVLGRFSVPVAQIERRAPELKPLAAPAPSARTNAAPVVDAAMQRRLDELLAAYVTRQITGDEFHRQRAKLLAGSAAAGPPTGTPPTKPVSPKPPKRWAGEAQAGADVGFNARNPRLYTGRFKLSYAQGRFRNGLDYAFTYGRSDGLVSANRMEGMLKTDYQFSPRAYVYDLGGGGYDEVRKLDSYFQFGPGTGAHLLKLTNFVLNAETGANFREENRTDGSQVDQFYHRFAESFTWALNSRVSLDEKFEYFPQWDNFDVYKLRFEMNLRYRLYENLSLNLTMVDIYDTQPARGVEQNDLLIRSTIGLRF